MPSSGANARCKEVLRYLFNVVLICCIIAVFLALVYQSVRAVTWMIERSGVEEERDGMDFDMW